MAAEIMYVTPTGAGEKDGTSWGNAFGLAEWQNDSETLCEPGDIYYVYKGTYTLASDFTAERNGTPQLNVKVIGVNSIANEPPLYADWAQNDDRPLIAAGAYRFFFDNNFGIHNLRVTTAISEGFRGDDSYFENCKSTNTSGNAIYSAFRSYSKLALINCEAAGTNVRGFYASGNGARVIGCYFHDLTYAIYTAIYDIHISFCVIANCPYGIYASSNVWGHSWNNNTFYNCSIWGIGLPNNTYATYIMNNNFQLCGVGIRISTECKNIYYDYNNYFNNTLDVENVTKGPNATAYDPKFVDAPGGNFAMDPASECIGAGFSIKKGVGS